MMRWNFDALIEKVVNSNEWHLITCGYPTQSGGVSDYKTL